MFLTKVKRSSRFMQELGISHYNRAGVLRLPRSIPHPISMVVWPHDRLIHLNDKRTSEKI